MTFSKTGKIIFTDDTLKKMGDIVNTWKGGDKKMFRIMLKQKQSILEMKVIAVTKVYTSNNTNYPVINNLAVKLVQKHDKVNIMTDKNKKLQNEICEIKAAKKERDNEISKLMRTIVEKDLIINESSARVTSTKNQMEFIKNNEKHLTQKICNHEGEIAILKNDLAGKGKIINVKNNKIDELKEEVKKLNSNGMHSTQDMQRTTSYDFRK